MGDIPHPTTVHRPCAPRKRKLLCGAGRSPIWRTVRPNDTRGVQLRRPAKAASSAAQAPSAELRPRRPDGITPVPHWWPRTNAELLRIRASAPSPPTGMTKLSSQSPPPSSVTRRGRRLGVKDDAEFAALSVGNCSAAKNHSAIIRSYDRCCWAGAWTRMVYLHCGIVSSDEGERASGRTAGGVADRIRFLGSVVPISRAYFAADAYLMTSIRSIRGLFDRDRGGGAPRDSCVLTDDGRRPRYLQVRGGEYCRSRNPQSIARALSAADEKRPRDHRRTTSRNLSQTGSILRVGRQRYLDLYEDISRYDGGDRRDLRTRYVTGPRDDHRGSARSFRLTLWRRWPSACGRPAQCSAGDFNHLAQGREAHPRYGGRAPGQAPENMEYSIVQI